MAQTGYTKILIYASGTTSNVPLAADLTSSLSGAELALNYYDGKLFYKDNAGVVQVLATKATGTIGGSTTQVQYNLSGALAGSANLTFNGTTLTANALTTTSTVTINGGTANGVGYLNASKVLTTGSALTFDGTSLGIGNYRNVSGFNRAVTLDVPTSGNGAYEITYAGTVVGTIRSDSGTYEVRSGATDLILNANPSGNNAIVFKCNFNTEGMRLTSTGLGIGTSSPGYKLDVNGAINSSNDIISQGANARFSLYRSAGINYFDWASGQDLYFSTQTSAGGAGRATKMTLDASGNLLVGATSLAFAEKFQMYGNYAVFNNASYTGFIGSGSSLGTGTATDFAIRSSNALAFLTGGGTERARIDSSGNLGLGVTPAAWNGSSMQIAGNIGFTNAGNFTANAYYNGTFKYTTSGSLASTYQQSAGIHTWSTAPSGTAGNTITFTEAMRLDANGNLLVGGTSLIASEKISVQTNANSAQYIWVRNSNTGASAASAIALNASGNTWGIECGSSAKNSNSLTFVLDYSGTNSEKMRLDTSGNLGLGVTPSAWSQGRALEVLNAGYGFWNGTLSSYVVANTYFNGGFKYADTGSAATHYYQYQGQHVWSTAASGTAGNAITFTQAMTLDASGNLLVGTTSYSTAPAQGFVVSGNSATAAFIGHANGTASGATYVGFSYNGTGIGSITQSGTAAVLYNVTSDRRLKDNITDADSASDLIDAIKVRQFDWKSDGNHQRYGMIAQELHEVAPEAVHSPADPDDMMAVDYSKLVPMLVKEIQSLRVRLNALENK